MMNEQNAQLVLSDGTVFPGISIGAPVTNIGEVVFNTSMTGYQEMLTDPSYRGQILTLTYPLIGNYGVTEDDWESSAIQVRGLIVKQLCDRHSNWRAVGALDAFLREKGVPGIAGVDTRMLTRIIRSHGVMMGALSADGLSAEQVLKQINETPSYDTFNFVKEVSAGRVYPWNEPVQPPYDVAQRFQAPAPLKINVVDYGVKRNILRLLTSRNCQVHVVPCDATPETIMEGDPDGIAFSPGPGDPRLLNEYLKNMEQVVTSGKPILGICLGHQFMGLVFGGRIFKLKFGHRGSNHPVKDLLREGVVHITAQNHGYAVDADSLAGTGLHVSHINLNDGTVEGMVHETLPIMTMQFHPEASGGPRDTEYMFDEFVRVVAKDRGACAVQV
ncbi:MAG TPA: glutamine-hydrolyzing carbamoyl-phosphate synthase small subunit [Armatimonadota bacterium]